MSDEKLKVIPSADDPLRASVSELRRALPIMSELAVEIARARKRSYDAHIKAGFTPDQALALCKQLTI